VGKGNCSSHQCQGQGKIGFRFQVGVSNDVSGWDREKIEGKLLEEIREECS